MNTNIAVVSYNSDWPHQFNKEKQVILAHLSKANVAALHHIGSTSVPQLCAKPIIDMLLEVNDLDKLDIESEKLSDLGYEVMGEFGIAGRRYFRKGIVSRTHHLHAFLAGSDGVKRHLAFRDYLITFPDIATQYAKVKQEAVNACNQDMEKYIAFKNDFIQYHEQHALLWRFG
ncbi:GrpB family protein [Pseudoalteromonas piscicida]|uniref:GrpB family protein n=1 Tax=Pseudoalteromonas piscicida TaxID=43662 RepID=UPI000E35E3D7|nr:GrpB family protein [Pseudoalteromonas piscicida]AXQ99255.1 GrpB family protein [Pseudoalteromonas piscicida]